ncbi:hypothetical protein [Nocardia brasiliensis]|uniref:Uncharacterized protein n=1 Tax=Nocardia brasiliensis (strain ATCC 700358 / HUJEG-1) TaxID=1133849 RepID=K0F1F3_NOCB7|nr:hypothetical protein [Nocardia brasiliensis]AFU02950.1 hypothetical protein O3I_024995 [Nocardia brasiliensis ATCC 700358]OCF86022.1 hypothetical protein AW168_33210 [Nocardia brasiliensis]
MDERLDRFLAEVAPEVAGADLWSAEGLDRAEHALLQRFPKPGTEDSPANQQTVDGFARFVGEVFRRHFGGQWYNVPAYDDSQRTRGFGPVLCEGYCSGFLGTVPLVSIAVQRRTGTEWRRVLDYCHTRYTEWVQSGRPTPP